ncbi:hypothetical protein PENTCL1PPCAC_1429, partial [Pristionchus entomophagus]
QRRLAGRESAGAAAAASEEAVARVEPFGRRRRGRHLCTGQSFRDPRRDLPYPLKRSLVTAMRAGKHNKQGAGSAGRHRSGIPRIRVPTASAAPQADTVPTGRGGGGAETPVRAPRVTPSATSIGGGSSGARRHRRGGGGAAVATSSASASRLARAALTASATRAAAEATPLVPTFALPVVSAQQLPTLLSPAARLGSLFAAAAAPTPPPFSQTPPPAAAAAVSPSTATTLSPPARTRSPIITASLPEVRNTSSVESLPEWFKMMEKESRVNLMDTVEEEERSEEESEEEGGDCKSAGDGAEEV